MGSLSCACVRPRLHTQASLQYAKESILLKTLEDVAENDKRTQTLELTSSVVWKGKSAVLTSSLADAMMNNTKVTALNLCDCNVGDAGLCSLADAIKENGTLFELNLSHNKFARTGLTHLAKCCLLYTSPSPRDKRQSRMPSSA